MSRESRYLTLAVAIGIAFAAAFQGPRLADVYTVEEDFRSFHWMHLFQRPDLFPHDPLFHGRILEIDLGFWQTVVYERSPGYSLMFAAASQLFEPVLFSKLLVFPLIVTAVYYMFRIGERLKGPGTALGLSLAFVVFNLASPTSISVIGGLQRSFVCPLLLALSFYLMAERYRAAGVVLLISALFYPPVFALGAVTWGLALVRPADSRLRVGIEWRRAIPLAVSLGLAVLVLAPVLANLMELAKETTDAGAAQSFGLLSKPEHLAGGRRQLFNVFPIVGRAGLTLTGINIIHIVALATISLIMIRMRPVAVVEFPREFKALFFASMLCFGLSWAVALATSAFPLYLPSRYTQASLFLFVLVFVTANAEESLHKATESMRQNSGRLVSIVVPVFILVMVLVIRIPEDTAAPAVGQGNSRWVMLALNFLLLFLTVLFLYRKRKLRLSEQGPSPVALLNRRNWAKLGVALMVVGFFYVAAVKDQFYVADEVERELYSYLESLPTGTRLAGAPCGLSGVPLFAKREVLYSCENVHPDARVVLAGLEAYYAESLLEVAAFCKTFDVDYLLVDSRDFEREHLEMGRYFFEPYDSTLYPVVSTQKSFALANIPARLRVFEAKTWFLMDCRQSSFASIAYLD